MSGADKEIHKKSSADWFSWRISGAIFFCVICLLSLSRVRKVRKRNRFFHDYSIPEWNSFLLTLWAKVKRDISLKRNRVSLSLVLFFSLRVPIEILFIKTPKKEVKRVEEESLKRYLVKQKRELFLSLSLDYIFSESDE